jgi:hypothetical protein
VWPKTAFGPTYKGITVKKYNKFGPPIKNRGLPTAK